MYWIFGFAFSLGIGHIAVKEFYSFLHRKMGIDERPVAEGGNWTRVPPWITGLVERAFFTLVVGAQVAGAPPAMIGWLAIKFATYWNYEKNEDEFRHRAFAALVTGLVSLLIATIGGLICQANPY